MPDFATLQSTESTSSSEIAKQKVENVAAKISQKIEISRNTPPTIDTPHSSSENTGYFADMGAITFGSDIQDIKDVLSGFSRDINKEIKQLALALTAIFYLLSFFTSNVVVYILLLLLAHRELDKRLKENQIPWINEADVRRSDRLIGKDGSKGPERKESVEWLNKFLQRVWPLVSPDAFVPVADLFEDVLQSQIPSMVVSVYSF